MFTNLLREVYWCLSLLFRRNPRLSPRKTLCPLQWLKPGISIGVFQQPKASQKVRANCSWKLRKRFSSLSTSPPGDVSNQLLAGTEIFNGFLKQSKCLPIRNNPFINLNKPPLFSLFSLYLSFFFVNKRTRTLTL